MKALVLLVVALATLLSGATSDAGLRDQINALERRFEAKLGKAHGQMNAQLEEVKNEFRGKLKRMEGRLDECEVAAAGRGATTGGADYRRGPEQKQQQRAQWKASMAAKKAEAKGAPPLQASSQLGPPVNPKDYGAVGNCTRMQDEGPRCYVDDAPALQKAIDAAQLYGRSLLIPAGIYGIKSPLYVHCTGALDLVHHNGPTAIIPGAASLCTGVEGTRWFHPLRISGEGMENSVIIATAKMEAVLMLGKVTSVNEVYSNVSSNIDVEQLHLDAARQANYGLLSLGVIRSRFSHVAVSGALKVGMKLKDGFILYVHDCQSVKNMVAGLWLEANANGVEVTDTTLSNNEGLGIYIERGQQ